MAFEGREQRAMTIKQYRVLMRGGNIWRRRWSRFESFSAGFCMAILLMV